MSGSSRRSAVIILLFLTMACGLPVGPLADFAESSPEETPIAEQPTRLQPEIIAPSLVVPSPTSDIPEASPVPSAAPPSTETPAPPLESTVISGWVLRFDPLVWEAVKADDIWVDKLLHRRIPGCMFEPNLGFGPPRSWARVDERFVMDGNEVDIETWTDTMTGFPILIVYEYPPDDASRRIELMMREVPGSTLNCTADAEQVIRHSLP